MTYNVDVVVKNNQFLDVIRVQVSHNSNSEIFNSNGLPRSPDPCALIKPSKLGKVLINTFLLLLDHN